MSATASSRPTAGPSARARPALAAVLRAPLWLAELATGAKSFVDNPILGSERLNRLGLHTARVRLAHAMADRRRRKLAHLASAEDRDAFARDGFIARRDFMPADLYAAVCAEVGSIAVEAREQLQGDTVTRRIPLDPETLKRMPAMARLLELPEWRGLLRYVSSFDCEPVITVQAILSHVAEGPPDPQTNFHIDTFHPTMKAWLFLTDVAEDEGPFTYVPGSHRPTKRRLAWERRLARGAARNPDRLTGRGSFRATRAQLKRLGYGEPVAFAVPGNTLVVGDTVGFHARGPSLRPSVRIEVWAYDRHNPFLPTPGLDLWSALGLARWRTRLAWWALDRGERLGLARNVWRPVGAVTADAPPKLG
ncbi:phytanoyl-CoA dioxygenase family protein [Methylobacterium segetis]|uniref:phytanoyl-CoA dioxygenase family protein n=1 Tax=Methylobacterium segetis TaxID=2488750 RepID=UPI0010434259|nr:phytanoyl-CoA dioxygenase family protein [Methylobacterium segetis]